MRVIKKGRKFHYEGGYTAKKKMDTDTFANDIAVSFERCGLVTEIQGDVVVAETSTGLFDRNYKVEFDFVVSVDIDADQVIDIISNQIMLSSRYLIGRDKGSVKAV